MSTTIVSSNKENGSESRINIKVVVSSFIALVVDGMDLQILSLALPVLMTEFNIDKVAAGALGTYTLIGMGIGGIFASWLADRIGRAKITAYSLIFFSIATGLLALTNSYYQFAAIRFLSGFGLAAVYIVANMLAAEYVPTTHRTTVLGTLQAGWSVGYVIAALLASQLLPKYGWRPLFAIAIIPAIFGIWMLRFIPEPPVWAMTRKSKAEQKNEWVEILSNKATRKIFIFWAFTATALQFGYYGANTWLPSYIVKELGVNLKNMTWYVAGTYTAMILGKVVAGWLGDVFGRRVMYTLAGLLTALALPLIVKFANPSNVAVLLLIFGLLYAAPYAINATYMAESFPTSIRSTAVGTAYNVGRVGGILAPIFIGYVATYYSIGAGIALLGIAYALAGLIPGIFIREKLFDPKSS